MTPDKYNEVWVYRQLTDLLKQLMDDGNISPTDVIESAKLACEMHFNGTDAVYTRENNMNLEEIQEITKSAALDWYSGDKELLNRVRDVTLSEFHRKVTPSVVMELLDQIEILSRGSHTTKSSLVNLEDNIV